MSTDEVREVVDQLKRIRAHVVCRAPQVVVTDELRKVIAKLERALDGEG